jgi:hypothetical protein
MHSGSLWGKLKATYKENLKIEWLILLKGETRWEGLDFINLAQNRGKWQAVTKTEIKLRIP